MPTSELEEMTDKEVATALAAHRRMIRRRLVTELPIEDDDIAKLLALETEDATRQMAYRDTREGAIAVLKDNALPELVAKAATAESSREAEWVADPSVYGVWGLVKTGTDTALVVVYVREADFTFDEEWLYA